MTRPKLKRKPPRRVLNDLQRLIVAKEILAGKSMKVVAADWRISRAYVHKIFNEHLVYRVVWREGKEPR